MCPGHKFLSKGTSGVIKTKLSNIVHLEGTGCFQEHTESMVNDRK